MSYESVKRRIFEVVEVAREGDRASRTFDLSIMTLIVLNVIALTAETVRSLGSAFSGFFYAFEFLSVMVFTVEYVLRMWSCTSAEEYAHPLWGRLRFARKPLPIIDLLAILPFYLPFLGVDLRFLRIVRLFRVLRLAKLARYMDSVRILGKIFANKKEELSIVMSSLVILLIIASSLMYYVENGVQPEVFSSIPAAMWWAVATLTTVGYGDTYPVSVLGKALGSVIAILGIAMFALPTAILGSGFMEELEKRRSEPMRCPHCGREIAR